MLDAVRAAAADHERVRIQYYAASSAETTVREVDPEEIFHAIGNWYVVAWDQLSGEERLFRADRIKRVEPTGSRSSSRARGCGAPSLHAGQDEDEVRLLLGPDARWVAEYYQTVEETSARTGPSRW